MVGDPPVRRVSPPLRHGRLIPPNVVPIDVSPLCLLRQLDDGESDGNGTDVDNRDPPRRPVPAALIRVIRLLLRRFVFVDRCPTDGFTIRAENDPTPMAFELPKHSIPA